MSKKDVTIIGSSDGPTSVFLASGNNKANVKQNLQKKILNYTKNDTKRYENLLRTLALR